MFMVMAHTQTGRDLDRQYQERAAKEAEEQKMLDQLTVMEQKRNANTNGLQEESKEQMTKSLLGAGEDDAVPDVMTLDYDAILKELEIQRTMLTPRLSKAKTLKDITGAEQAKGGDRKVNYDFALTIANHIYNGKIEIINLIPPNNKLIEIQKALMTAIKNANFKEYRSFDKNGLDMFLAGQLDQPTLFTIFANLFTKICHDQTVIEDSIDTYNQLKNTPPPSNAFFAMST